MSKYFVVFFILLFSFASLANEQQSLPLGTMHYTYENGEYIYEGVLYENYPALKVGEELLTEYIEGVSATVKYIKWEIALDESFEYIYTRDDSSIHIQLISF